MGVELGGLVSMNMGTWRGNRGQRLSKEEITIKKAHNLSTVRAMCANPEAIDEWFVKYEACLKEWGIMDETGQVDASRIWNCDEKGLFDIPKESYAIGIPGEKLQQTVGADRGTLSTLLLYICADGTYMEPMVIHKGARVGPTWRDHAWPGVKVRCSDTGYIKSHLFLESGEHFIAHLKQKGELSAERKHCLLLDGHSAHLFNLAFMLLMIKNFIEVFCFVPHTSQDSQPADDIVFKEVNTGWNDDLRVENRHGGRLVKSKFLLVLHSVLLRALKAKNIIASFRATGVCPVDRSKITDEQLAPSKIRRKFVLAVNVLFSHWICLHLSYIAAVFQTGIKNRH